MFGGNFQTWKLHSAQDYFMFFAYILAGVMVFWLIAKHMNKQRNHEKAVEKVSARLKKICGKPGEVLKNATLNLPEGKMTFDAVLMDPSMPGPRPTPPRPRPSACGWTPPPRWAS